MKKRISYSLAPNCSAVIISIVHLSCDVHLPIHLSADVHLAAALDWWISDDKCAMEMVTAEQVGTSKFPAVPTLRSLTLNLRL